MFVLKKGKKDRVKKNTLSSFQNFNFRVNLHLYDFLSVILCLGSSVMSEQETLVQVYDLLHNFQSRNLQKPSLDTTRAKSLEERQQVYEEVRSRIFTGEEQIDNNMVRERSCSFPQVIPKIHLAQKQTYNVLEQNMKCNIYVYNKH